MNCSPSIIALAVASRAIVEVAKRKKEVATMTWETPTVVEIKMDAEINSYQDDFGDGPDAT